MKLKQEDSNSEEIAFIEQALTALEQRDRRITEIMQEKTSAPPVDPLVILGGDGPLIKSSGVRLINSS
jgi:hypothetical protein